MYLGQLLFKIKGSGIRKTEGGNCGVKKEWCEEWGRDIKDDHSSIAREGEEEREEAGLG